MRTALLAAASLEGCCILTAFALAGDSGASMRCSWILGCVIWLLWCLTTLLSAIHWHGGNGALGKYTFLLNLFLAVVAVGLKLAFACCAGLAH